MPILNVIYSLKITLFVPETTLNLSRSKPHLCKDLKASHSRSLKTRKNIRGQTESLVRTTTETTTKNLMKSVTEGRRSPMKTEVKSENGLIVVTKNHTRSETTEVRDTTRFRGDNQNSRWQR